MTPTTESHYSRTTIRAPLSPQTETWNIWAQTKYICVNFHTHTHTPWHAKEVGEMVAEPFRKNLHMCGCALSDGKGMGWVGEGKWRSMSHSYIKLLKASCKSLQGIATQPQQPPLALDGEPSHTSWMSWLSFLSCRHLSNAVTGLQRSMVKLPAKIATVFPWARDRSGKSSPAAEKLTTKPNRSLLSFPKTKF